MQFGNVDLHWGLLRDLGLHRFGQTIILVAESCTVQSLDDVLHGSVKIVGGSQHIGHIQSRLCVLACMGQTEDTPQNLLHIHLTGFVGKGRKNIGKGAIPALFQRIDRDDIANRAIGRHQIHIFQFVHISRANGNLLCRDASVHQLVPQFFKGGSVLLAFWLCLEQGDGANIFARFGILRICKFFQLISQINSVNQHIGLTVPVVNNHGQLDHVLALELHRVHIGDNVALLFRRSGQIQYEAGIEVFQHFKAEIRPGVVALVHNHQRVKLVDNLEQGCFIRLFNGVVWLAKHLGKLGKIAVLLIGFQALLAAPTERIIGQHHDGKLFGDGSGIEILAVQKLLLGVDLHAPAKIHVDFLTVGMLRVFEGFHRLHQNCVRGNKPHNRLCLGNRQSVKNGADGITGDKGLAAACGHLEAEVGDTGQNILIVPQCGRAFFLPEEAERRFIILGFIQQFQIAGQVRYDLFLIAF